MGSDPKKKSLERGVRTGRERCGGPYEVTQQGMAMGGAFGDTHPVRVPAEEGETGLAGSSVQEAHGPSGGGQGSLEAARGPGPGVQAGCRGQRSPPAAVAAGILRGFRS